MIPPKYNFYVGKSVYTAIYSNKTIDSTGEYISNSSRCASSSISLYSLHTVFINVNPAGSVSTEAYRIYIHCYNGSTYLGKVYTAGSEIVNLLNNTTQIAITFYKSNTDIYEKSQNDVTFIYIMQPVNPHYKDLSKKYAKESGQEFFRISLDGKINLFGQDYEFVKNSSLEDQLIFIVDKYNRTSEKWVEYYKGEFNKTDCKFDYDKKKCELKTTAIDNYNEVMNKYENTYDLIKLAPAITRINLHKRSLMQVYVRGANSVSNFFGGIYWEDDVNEAINDHNALINKYYFSYIKAGNEFYVRGAGISDVNGVYAGTNGYWSCWNGYTCYMGTDTPMTYAYIYIRRNSDNTILYQSVKQYVFTEADNCYIGREDIEMVNVNDSTDKFTIESPFVYHIYRRLLCDVDTVEDSEGVKNTYNLPSDDFVTDNRNYKKCIGLRGGLFFCTSRAIDEPTRFGLNDYGQYFTSQFIPSSSGLGRALPISRNSWANASLWYVYDITYEMFEERLRKQYTLRDSYSIAAVIKALLNKIDPTLKHEATAEYSRFLYDATVPISMNRFYVFITQKTNILKGEYDQPAQKAEISFEDLMKMLRDCFRCYWYIEDGKFKIEHISFFMKGGSYSYNSNVQLDFTKLTDQFNKKMSAYFQSEIEYDKSDLNQRYEFGWMDDVTDLFGGLTVDVKSNYVQKDKNEEINISQFSSDIDYMLFNPSNFSDDGFALLCPLGADFSTNLIYTSINDVRSNLGINNTGKIVEQSWNLNILKVNPGSKYYFKNTKYAINGVGALGFSNQKITEVGAQIASYVDISTLPEENGYKVIIPTTEYIYYNVTPLDYNFGSTLKIYDASYSLPIVKTTLVDEDGDSYEAIVQNWYASWAYLVHFYMYDMPAGNIDCDVLNNLYVDAVKMCMKHTVEFPIEEDLDELELIKTSIGDGKIDEYSVNMNTRTAKVKLTYSPQ